MSGISLSLLIIYLSLHYARQDKTADVETGEHDDHFDILTFTQEWPVTVCKKWIHNNGTGCVYPNEKNEWTVHGIWPSVVEWNTIASKFCKNSSAFDPEQIKSIEGELEQAWTNIYKGTDSYIYWGHEWLKHGTCISQLESFSSQFKYFSKGIEWHQKYSLLGMFNAANIFPDDTKEFTAEELAAAVKAKTKKIPMVICYPTDGVQYLVGMRICFDIQLNLIDCNPVAKHCDLPKGIIFPANA